MTPKFLKYNLSLFIILALLNLTNAAIIINEFMASNKSAYFDEDQETPDWIELFNTSSNSVNLEGWYISDEENDLNKWQFPNVVIAPNEFLIVFASGKDKVSEHGLHTNFKLGADGEMILLSNPFGEIIDYYAFGEQQENQSLGRLADGSEEWGFYSKSSPAESNAMGILAEISSTTLHFSHLAGKYSEPIDLVINSDNPAVSIYFSTNGNSPTPEDNLFESSIFLKVDNLDPAEIAYIPTAKVWQSPVGEVPKFHTIRARAFINDVPVSKTYSSSFLINAETSSPYTFPVISITTDQQNLFDYENGVYIIGKDYNFNKKGIEWERQAHLEYFDTNFEFGFNQNLGLRVTGNASRNMPQKSLKLYARSEYGDNRIRYPLFGENYDSTFKRIKLRNINGDRNGTGLSDDLAHDIISGKVNTDFVMRQFVIVFINGEYWGIHSMRESLDEHLLGRRLGIDNNDISLGHAHKYGIDTINGSLNNYFELLDFIRSNDIKTPESYEYLSSKIDIDNLQELFVSQIFLANSDWPHHNNRFWQVNNPETKWRWMFFDLDAAFKTSVSDNLGFIFQPELDAAGFSEPEDFELINSLMKNPTFATSFRNKMYQMLDNVFATERTVPILEKIIKKLEPEMEAHIRRWNYPHSMERWHKDLGDIRDFLVRRPHYISGELLRRLGAPIKVFPNPATAFFKVEVELTENQDTNIELVDVSGNSFQIDKKNLLAGKQTFEIEIPDYLQTGMYVLKIQTKKRMFVEKIMIL